MTLERFENENIAAGGGPGRLKFLVSSVSDYMELTKPNVTTLILMSTAVGFYLGSHGSIKWLVLFHTLLGTALVASGTAALNEFWERDIDAKMLRTRNRPLPSGKMEPWKALCFGILLAIIGTVYLALAANLLASVCAALTLVSYLFFYTPLKTRTPLCTLVGAFPGAIPPLIGWVAASGRITPAAGILCLMLFLWQFPHFLAIASMYREDYERGGIVMLPVVEPDGRSTGRQMIRYAAILLPISLLPSLLGITGIYYLVGTMLAGAGYLAVSTRTASLGTVVAARQLLRASVIYLPLIYGLMLFDKRPL